MQINISNLSEGEHEYDLSEEAQKLGWSEDFTGQIDVHVTLGKSLNQLIATIQASVKGVFVCDRCARNFESEVKTTFHSVYSWEHDAEQGVGDDFYVLAPDQNVIDISESVKEYLLLAVPFKRLCGKKDCKIPNQPVLDDDSVDPRWDKLRELKRHERM